MHSIVFATSAKLLSCCLTLLFSSFSMAFPNSWSWVPCLLQPMHLHSYRRRRMPFGTLLSVPAAAAGRIWVGFLSVIPAHYFYHNFSPCLGTPLLSDLPPLHLFCHYLFAYICHACCSPTGLIPYNSYTSDFRLDFFSDINYTQPSVQFCYCLTPFLSLLCRNHIYGRTAISVDG